MKTNPLTAEIAVALRHHHYGIPCHGLQAELAIRWFRITGR